MDDQDFSGDFTVEAWVYLDSLPSVGNMCTIASLEDKFYFVIDSDGELKVTGCFDSDGTVGTGGWHHVGFTLTWSGSNPYVRYFIDGDFESEGDYYSNVGGWTDKNFRIGGDQDGSGWWFDGKIDEVRVSTTGRYTATTRRRRTSLRRIPTRCSSST